MSAEKEVLIIEAQMKRYRAPCYEQLHEALRRDGIHLTVAYSDPPPQEEAKADFCDLSNDCGLKVPAVWLWRHRLLLQPLLGRALRADLVIVNQANKFVLNHFLLPLSRAGLRRLAFWGHGEIRQAKQRGFSHWYRQATLDWVSWWFAYTGGAARYLESRGVPAWRITTVHNSLDTRSLHDEVSRLTLQDRNQLRSRMGIPFSAHVGIFCGALDPVKDIPFLIESCRIIKARVGGFHLLLVGAGREEAMVRKLVRGVPWIHFLGPRFGVEKAALLAISDVFLLPGAVGLAVLDAFSAGLPMITTEIATHGPEIEYLEDGVSGRISEHDPCAYANAVSSLFTASGELERMRQAATATAGNYSIEKMVANFQTGVEACLGASWSRARLGEDVLRGICADTTDARPR